jgi:hypothetical protein
MTSKELEELRRVTVDKLIGHYMNKMKIPKIELAEHFATVMVYGQKAMSIPVMYNVDD